ncbi:MAG TPA: hypothetical protein VHS76_15535, partial [Steroidobacteraceae bacterium]|nr:hypothetical protein [Steroidobacteraceae bacterium]
RHGDGVEFHTAAMSVRIERSSLRIIVSDLTGHVIMADAPTKALEVVGSGFMLRKELAPKVHVFGLGDKTGPLDRRGQAFTLWNTDAYRFQESTDPIYKSIPFFVAAGGAAAATESCSTTPGAAGLISASRIRRRWLSAPRPDRSITT